MEIKKDPEYRRPPEAPQNQNSDRYCEFHEVNGQYTEGCIALRHLIEKFIENGKLVRFLGKQRHPREERVRREEHRGRPTCPTHEPQHQANLQEICTIIGGFAGGGESRRVREAYARQLEGSHKVYTVRRPVKQSRRTEMVIGFSDVDYLGISHPHTDTLVITQTVANHNVHRILVNNGSSADILYRSAFKKLNLRQEKIVPTNYPLMEFMGEQVQPIGSIELPVTAGSYPRQATIMVRFLLVDRPSAYNAIIERMALNELRAITSTPHLKVKFLTDHGVGEIRGDQWAAQQCYNISMKECPKIPARGTPARRKDNN
ncbi:uncharacterized protein LOC132185359 [Corylus avellana]|uniref:uncharacterized protein LOC132185359 n=1 Tax=Corylus avellana TaxID=13451 RepID=UPI00286C0025|nr:uncharacterized protein LOC132185359 [Corylus avellana]